MRRLYVILFACLLSATLVIRATPRACGSAFACCGEPTIVAKHVAPCCEKNATPKSPTHAGDESMACCMPLTMSAMPDGLDLAPHALAGDGAPHVERSMITHTLEPATPPPRAIA